MQKLRSMVIEEQVAKNFEDYYPSFTPQTLNNTSGAHRQRSFQRILTDMQAWKHRQEI